MAEQDENPKVTDLGRETEAEDGLSLDVLSEEDLVYIANNPGYRDMLLDLIAPYTGGTTDRDLSADNADKFRGRRGIDTTRHEPAQLEREVESPDQRSTSSGASADNTDPGILQKIAQVLGKRKQGATPPACKRQKVSDTDSDSFSEGRSGEPQLFDPSLDREDKEEFRFEAPGPIGPYLEQHLRRGLSKEERTAMLRKHPKPDTKVMNPPKLDQFITEFSPKKVDKARDASLTKIQGALLYAVNPLANLWANLIEQDLDSDPKALIPVPDVLDVIQRSLVLIGNANNLLAETRREVALDAVHPSLKKYAKGDFTEAGSDLFGEKFKEELVKKVEADTVLSKAVGIVSRSSKVYRSPSTGTKAKSPLFQNRTSGYGAAFGKRYNPYQTQSSSYRGQGRGRSIRSRPYHKRGSVFDRLGHFQEKPQSSRASDQYD